MSIITVVVVLIVAGLCLWLVQNFIPMDAKVKQLLTAVVIVALVLWLLFMILPLAGLGNIRVGR